MWKMLSCKNQSLECCYCWIKGRVCYSCCVDIEVLASKFQPGCQRLLPEVKSEAVERTKMYLKCTYTIALHAVFHIILYVCSTISASPKLNNFLLVELQINNSDMLTMGASDVWSESLMLWGPSTVNFSRVGCSRETALRMKVPGGRDLINQLCTNTSTSSYSPLNCRSTTLEVSHIKEYLLSFLLNMCVYMCMCGMWMICSVVLKIEYMMPLYCQ